MKDDRNDGLSAVELATEEAQKVTRPMVEIDADLVAVFYRRLLERNVPEDTAIVLAAVYLNRMHIYGGDG